MIPVTYLFQLQKQRRSNDRMPSPLKDFEIGLGSILGVTATVLTTINKRIRSMGINQVYRLAEKSSWLLQPNFGYTKDTMLIDEGIIFRTIDFMENMQIPFVTHDMMFSLKLELINIKTELCQSEVALVERERENDQKLLDKLRENMSQSQSQSERVEDLHTKFDYLRNGRIGGLLTELALSLIPGLIPQIMNQGLPIVQRLANRGGVSGPFGSVDAGPEEEKSSDEMWIEDVLRRVSVESLYRTT